MWLWPARLSSGALIGVLIGVMCLAGSMRVASVCGRVAVLLFSIYHTTREKYVCCVSSTHLVWPADCVCLYKYLHRHSQRLERDINKHHSLAGSRTTALQHVCNMVYVCILIFSQQVVLVKWCVWDARLVISPCLYRDIVG